MIDRADAVGEPRRRLRRVAERPEPHGARRGLRGSRLGVGVRWTCERSPALVVSGWVLGGALQARAVRNGAVQVELVARQAAVQPGQPFWVALRVEHDAPWHTYWLNAGTGYPTSLAWTLPEGFSAGPIVWPAPHTVKDTAGNVTGNGYEGTVHLFVQITPPATLAVGSTVQLRAAAENAARP